MQEIKSRLSSAIGDIAESKERSQQEERVLAITKFYNGMLDHWEYRQFPHHMRREYRARFGKPQTHNDRLRKGKERRKARVRRRLEKEGRRAARGLR